MDFCLQSVIELTWTTKERDDSQASLGSFKNTLIKHAELLVSKRIYFITASMIYFCRIYLWREL